MHHSCQFATTVVIFLMIKFQLTIKSTDPLMRKITLDCLNLCIRYAISGCIEYKAMLQFILITQILSMR